MGPGGAGKEFAFALEDGHVLGFEDFADDGDEDGGVLAVVVAGAFEADEQAGGEVFSGDGGGEFRFAGGVEGPFENVSHEGVLELDAVGEPLRFLGGGLFFGAGFFGSGFFGGGFFGGFGSWLCGRCVRSGRLGETVPAGFGLGFGSWIGGRGFRSGRLGEAVPAGLGFGC